MTKRVALSYIQFYPFSSFFRFLRVGCNVAASFSATTMIFEFNDIIKSMCTWRCSRPDMVCNCSIRSSEAKTNLLGGFGLLDQIRACVNALTVSLEESHGTKCWQGGIAGGICLKSTDRGACLICLKSTVKDAAEDITVGCFVVFLFHRTPPVNTARDKRDYGG